MKNNVLCACVIYPEVEHFARNCFINIQQQSYRKFDLIIVEDGISVEPYKRFLVDINYKVIPSIYLNPIKIREWLMKYAYINDYEKLIYFDTDDEYHKDRVEKVAKKLDDYDLVVHDMDIINENSILGNERFINEKIKSGEFSILDILERNFAGLGNSGYRVDKFGQYKTADANIIAFDWWLACNVLHNGKGVYINESLSFYRRYNGNTSNISITTKAQLDKELQVKTLLYTGLLSKCNLEKELYIKTLGLLKRTMERYYNLINEENEKNEHKEHLWWDYLN